MPNTFDYDTFYKNVARNSPEAATAPIRLLIVAMALSQQPQLYDDPHTLNFVCNTTEDMWLLTNSSDILFIQRCVNMCVDEPETFKSARAYSQRCNLADRIASAIAQLH